ncbi:MAG: hypothetical protein EA351_05685 [Gemmatimonadales bacterium]|nr:MAG: hypothetical protein EA351_05685 [Gemmatimonadales bacterium]
MVAPVPGLLCPGPGIGRSTGLALRPIRPQRGPGRTALVSCLIGILWILGACGGAEEESSATDSVAHQGSVQQLIDDAGRSWDLDRPPERIVSLVPSATGILIALGMRDRLVARTDFDRDEALAGLPSVGGGLNPSLERLLGVRPELVIRFEGPSDRATPETLDNLGVVHLAVRPDTIGDIQRIIGLLAAAVGEPERGAELQRELAADLEAVRRSVQGLPPPRVAFLLGGDPPWVAASGTFLDELLTIAGGENVFGDEGPLYAPMSVEEIIRREPDFLLLTEGSRIPGSLDRLPVRRVPESVQSPGVEVGRSAASLARILHPEAFR